MTHSKKFRLISLLFVGTTAALAAPPPAPRSEGQEQPTASEQKNISVALGYIEVVWNQHQPVEGFAKYVSAKSIHYPAKPGGDDPAGLARFLSNFPKFRYDVKHVYADGEYVVVHSLLTGVPGIGTPVTSPQPGAVPQSKVGDEVVDIFRVKDGKIIQHWDTVEPIGGDPTALF